MTAAALQATETDLWLTLAPVELGDSTREYVHVVRVEHRLRAAELRDAIVGAERWLAARERQFAAVERRAAAVQSAVVTGPSRSRSRS